MSEETRFLATEKAKRFVAQLNEQMKLYPEGYDATKTMNEEQRGQFVEQKEVMQKMRFEHSPSVGIVL